MIDVFIAGAQKAGTTSLAKYLSGHPHIATHEQMEMTHFYIDEEYETGKANLKNRYRFKAGSDTMNLGKHATHTRSEKAVKRLYTLNPKCKILFCVRDPVKRAFSSYLMEKRNKTIDCSFDEAITIAFREKNHWFYNVFVELGCYSNHIELLQKYHPLSNIKIIQLERLESDPNKVLHEVFSWLSLEEYNVKSYKKFNSKNHKSTSHLISKFNNLPTVKKAVLSLIGRSRIEKILALAVGNSVCVEETLNQYPDAFNRLHRFYETYNDKLLKSWNIEYN